MSKASKRKASREQMIKEYGVNFRVQHGGKFFKSGNAIKYEKGQVLLMREIFPNELSKSFLEMKIIDDAKLTDIRELYYLESGYNIDKGLRRVADDSVIPEMLKFADWDKFVHLYVVEGDSPGPAELRAFIQPNVRPSPSLDDHLQRRKPEPSKPRKLTPRKRNRAARCTPYKSPIADIASNEPLPAYQPALHSVTDLDNGIDEYEVIGSESGEEGGDSDFVETDDDFEDLFCENVDFGAADIVRAPSLPTDQPAPIEESNDELSDELLDELDSEGNRIGERKFPEFNEETDFSKPIELKRGLLFSSNVVFRKALRQYAIESGGDYYYLHNDKERVYAYCLHRCPCPLKHGRKVCQCGQVLCNWKVCAMVYAPDGTFQVKSIRAKHKCGWQMKNTKLTSVWLAERYVEHYRAGPGWSLFAFIETVRREHDIDITYIQAWRGRLRAMLITQGDATTQYGKVWDYAATIVRTNPGSSASVKVDDLGNPKRPLFLRLYVCLEACKTGFISGCRPIIGLDGCHLKGAYTGQMLVAVGMDGNNNIFPIAYAVVEAERKETWLWFLDLLDRDVGFVVPTYMSDRQKGLMEALRMFAPGVSQKRVCVRHMYKNFKDTWSGKQYKDLVWKAARSYTAAEFDDAMQQIKAMDEKAYAYLMEQYVASWSRHKFDKDLKCDILLNNMCECFNSWILPARELPILSMMEWIRRQLMIRFAKKRDSTAGYTQKFTPKAMALLEKAVDGGKKRCRAFNGGGTGYEVDQAGTRFIVDLDKMTCSCRKWESTGIPCVHAMSCILKARQSYDAYVSDVYTTELYMKAYGGIFHPVPGESGYVKTSSTPPLPPKWVIQPGRPKKNARRREEDEAAPKKKVIKRVRVLASKQKCSRCGQVGHNRRSCGNELAVPVKAQKNPGGRPTNPNTVHVGPKRKRASKKVPKASSQADAEVDVPLPSQLASDITDKLDIIQRRRSPKQGACNDIPGTSSSAANKTGYKPGSQPLNGNFSTRPPWNYSTQ